MQGISRALASQKLANMLPYTDEFRKNIRGRAPADLAQSYPEHEHARKVGKLTSKVGDDCKYLCKMFSLNNRSSNSVF